MTDSRLFLIPKESDSLLKSLTTFTFDFNNQKVLLGCSADSKNLFQIVQIGSTDSKNSWFYGNTVIEDGRMFSVLPVLIGWIFLSLYSKCPHAKSVFLTIDDMLSSLCDNSEEDPVLLETVSNLFKVNRDEIESFLKKLMPCQPNLEGHFGFRYEEDKIVDSIYQKIKENSNVDENELPLDLNYFEAKWSCTSGTAIFLDNLQFYLPNPIFTSLCTRFSLQPAAPEDLNKRLKISESMLLKPIKPGKDVAVSGLAPTDDYTKFESKLKQEKEDYGLQSINRRFFPLEQEFRFIIYNDIKSSELICLSSDGKNIWSFDAIDGILKLILQSSTDKFTSIQMKNETELFIGTFNGEIITKSLIDDSKDIKKYSEYPILGISSDYYFFDSQGRLFHNEKIIFDDGILQPCRILKSSKHHLLLIKHASIYIFDSQNDKFISKITHNEILSAAELDQNDNLIVCTDRGNLLTLDDFKIKALDKSSQESDDENSEDFEDSDKEISDKSERIFALIKNPNAAEILILKVDSINKMAWLEEISVNILTSNTKTIPNVKLTANVTCPLCNELQSLLINTNSCLKGHPITICSLTKQLIIKKGYKCRTCNCSFTTNPKTCPYCKGLITK